MAKRLYRSYRNKMVFGVCGGIGEYFNVDPVIIRLIWLASIFWLGGGVIAYLIAAVIIPAEDPNSIDEQ